MVQLGSRRWFGYRSDLYGDLAVELDESTYESVNLGFGGVVAGAIPIKANAEYPCRLRRVTCSRVVNDETLRASFYIGTRTAYDTLLASGVLTVDGVAWQIQRGFGEVPKLVPATDTAQLDGDVDNNFAA